jgi:guanine nucleotide-binding protein alpha-1 subunit
MFSPRTSSGITNAIDDPLTQALNGLVPSDEDPIARANRLALEAEARHVSEQIDEKLRLERLEKKNKKIVKILLLGQSDPPSSFRIDIYRLLLCGRLAYPHVDTPHTRVHVSGQSESGKSTTLKNIQLCYAPQSLRQEAYAWRTIIHLNLLRSMQIIIDTLSQANRENAPSFTDELRRLLIKLSPLKQAEELLKMKISLPQEEDGDSGMVLIDSNEFSVRSASGWKQAFNKMRGITNNKDDAGFDTAPATILEACADDMIGTHHQTPAALFSRVQYISPLDRSSGQAITQTASNTR